MGSMRIQQTTKFWTASMFVVGVILAVLAGLSWTRGLLPSGNTPAMHPAATPAWGTHIQMMDGALAQGATRAAEANWLVAQLEAQRSNAWEAWIGVGDAALRLGNATGSRLAFIVRARRAYRQAMLTAYEQRSQRGVLAAADAFAALGDEPLADDLRALTQKLPSPRG